MTLLRFRLPAHAQPLGAWLATLLPVLDRGARRRLIEDGQVRLDGRVFDRPKQDCPLGALVEIDAGGLASETVLALETLASAPDSESSHWRALVVTPPWQSGAVVTPSGAELEFVRSEVRGDLACLDLTGRACSAQSLSEALAKAAMPVVGDLLRGGLAVPGGPFLRDASPAADPAPLDWPELKVWRGAFAAERSDEEDQDDLEVSRETARAIAAGHPWILPDAASEPATRYRPGALVRVTERGGESIGWALVEGTPWIAARIWAGGGGDRRAAPSIESRVARAIARRRDLLVDTASSGTNAFRLVHGEGDELPGIFIDRLGPLLRVLVTGWASLEIRARVVEALRTQLPVSPEGTPWSVLELLHLRGRGADRVDRVRWLEGGLDTLLESGVERVGEGFWVEERGLRYSVDPGWDAPRKPRPGFGLFVDQRENRERVGQFAGEGGSWLNLFAHTGAFSVSLLASGAEEVVSVDLSRRYLDRLEGNLRANQDRGVDLSRHRSIRGDVRHFLEGLDPGQRYRGIVIDPPTAAAAGRHFWSVKQDLEPLLRSTIDRLEDAGTLLVTQNRAGPALGLDRVLEAILEGSTRRIDRLVAAPAGSDHPSRPGFPEGDPFEGWLVTLR